MAKVIEALGKAGGTIWNRTLGRLFGSGIGRHDHIGRATAAWSGRKDERDWRVRLTLPQTGPLKNFFFNEQSLGNNRLAPLHDLGGFFWPLTPSMMIQHTANYNALAQTHSNYPFQAYQNSQPNDINIIGDFIVQNSEDAKYWVASINFLRAVHKMFFGGNESDYRGNPPPILHLEGYGDQMFNKIPVVLNQWNVELRAGVDYICTQQQPYGGTAHQTGQPFLQNITSIDDVPATWAPTISMVSVMITPIYSRDAVKKFSMRKFVDGTLSKETGIGWV